MPVVSLTGKAIIPLALTYARASCILSPDLVSPLPEFVDIEEFEINDPSFKNYHGGSRSLWYQHVVYKAFKEAQERMEQDAKDFDAALKEISEKKSRRAKPKASVPARGLSGDSN